MNIYSIFLANFFIYLCQTVNIHSMIDNHNIEESITSQNCSSKILDLINTNEPIPDINEYYHLKTIYTLLYFLNMQINFDSSEGLFLDKDIFDRIIENIAFLDTSILYAKKKNR